LISLSRYPGKTRSKVEQLLTTKLFIPPTRPEFVPRSRLIARLDGGLHRKLTLISAPAGFGKTTVVAEWVDKLAKKAAKETQVENRIAWLSLDERDNDPMRFWSYFVVALKRSEGMDAAFGKGALNMLQSSQPPQTEVILTSLINEIAAANARIIFVLDDYHLINSQLIQNGLNFFLDNLPPQMHLVIATREDPQLSLSRLRARDQMTELRAADLRFSSSEAAEFLNQVMGLDLSAEHISALEVRTEGWIAGLQLAAISMRGRDDAANYIKSFTGSHRLVLDYLIEEVLERQPENIQTFLLQTAVLDRLTGSLCDALTRQDNGQQTLAYLEHSNLFIIPLDGVRHWFRYHHLFADLLRQRVQQTHSEQISALHSKASEWYERNDLPPDAIRHALVAKDFERAASLAEMAWPAWRGSYQSIMWLSWLKDLPDDVVRTRPVLSVGYAWAFLNIGNMKAAESRLRDAEHWLKSTPYLEDRPEGMVVVDEDQFQTLPAALAAARAYHAQAVGDFSGTVKYARQVFDLEAEGGSKFRSDVTALLGLAYWASGDLEKAHQTFVDGLAGMDPFEIIVGTFVLADIKMTLGRLHEAARRYQKSLQLAASEGESSPLGTEDLYTGISKLHRERGDLKAAAEDLSTARKLGEQIELPDWQYRWCIAQARLQESLGDLDGALDLLDDAERLYVRTPLPEVQPIPALKARVWAKRGRLIEALDWTRERGLSVDDDLQFLQEFEHITLARVLVAQYQIKRAEDSIHEAMGLMERLLQAAEEGGRVGSVIEILVLQALAFYVQGDTASAFLSLERALTLAEPEGYFSVFIEEGPQMAVMLNKIRLDDGKIKAYVRKLLAALKENENRRGRTNQEHLIEPLSERELEVLQLIAEGLTNQEIASRLYLSLNTVKSHAGHVYGKLGVRSRTQAIVRARELGILSSA